MFPFSDQYTAAVFLSSQFNLRHSSSKRKRGKRDSGEKERTEGEEEKRKVAQAPLAIAASLSSSSRAATAGLEPAARVSPRRHLAAGLGAVTAIASFGEEESCMREGESGGASRRREVTPCCRGASMATDAPPHFMVTAEAFVTTDTVNAD
ncbi:uncharacterized protein [Arachis hypogaea]|uniref:Uncharacterized protein n=1 Tax=Arachis hypogaea TaxID=3818 RepID=A0A444XMC9_ARAHY|nr:uncharacterized protein DS421_19g654210 [Arachis hypogaea]RYQ90766.1 hypothetical protein Ahy_B09g096763 isoform A [Arachis hypogaea]